MRSDRTTQRRAPRPALRWLRFILYAVLLGAGLALNAPALNLSLRVLTSRCYYAPTVPCLPCALGLLAVALGYAMWLAGATIASWRMPVWSHLAPIGLLLGTIFGGPLDRSPDPFAGQAPPERLMRAMAALKARAGTLSGDPCVFDVQQLRGALEDPAVPPSGWRNLGAPLSYELKLVPQGEPVKSPLAGDRPGTLYLACAGKARRYWISAVASDAIPRGEPTMVRDGLGRPAVLTGEAAP